MYIAKLYPVKFKVDSNGTFLGTMRDVPEFLTCGDTLIDAISMAVDGLHVAREFYLEEKRRMTEPSSVEEGEILIPLYVESFEEETMLFGGVGL